MTIRSRAFRRIALFLPLVLLGPPPAIAQQALPAPQHVQQAGETPWIYEGSDVPRDEEWVFGKLPNGLRYAVRRNGVPPDQISFRVRIDAGSLHEADSELGYAHLLEHLLFRQSTYLGPAEAIPTWERLGATFGSDTNAETSPTHTVYKLDLPNANQAKLEESFKLLSGMVRGPVLSDANVRAEVPIVLAEKRERGGPAERASKASRNALFAGQKLAARDVIGTDETLNAATGQSVEAFYDRWYRPENTVVAIAGDADPMVLAALVERWFGDWKAEGQPTVAPDFGDPVPPAGATGATPVGEVAVIVEPDLPRSFTYAVMRPWRQVDDTIVYNEGRLRQQLALLLINRRLEARARGGGSFLDAGVQQDNISRSANLTFVSFSPLTNNWQAALHDVRGVIADALTTPPSQAEIDRELAEMEVGFANLVEQRSVLSGASLADDLVNAVDIREAVAAPETFLLVFNSMKAKLTPQLLLEQTRDLFTGSVVRAAYLTPATGEANEASVRAALSQEVAPDTNARLSGEAISFADQPAIGTPGEVVREGPIGVLAVERVDFANGVKAILWANNDEPGRVAVKVRFGGGYRAIGSDDAAYVTLGQSALIASGLGNLGQDELDRISTGRKLGFDFQIGEGAFVFSAQTREQDLADQLYLFAAKLGQPRWDPNPVLRAKAAAQTAYQSYATSPVGVLRRDLDYLLRDRDPRFMTATPDMLADATPEGFRRVWEPLLAQGPVEVLVFGEFDRDAIVETLRKTFGALPTRAPLPQAIAAKGSAFPDADETVVLNHRGEVNQAAAVVAWPSGAGVDDLRESRQLEILVQLFNNRLMEAMRERAGASYAPVVRSEWPSDVTSGGKISALAQLKPEDVPAFFKAADDIARDLTAKPVSADELQRVTEPLLQSINRAATGNTFWLYQLEGATIDPRRAALLRSLQSDYTQTTPQAMQTLAVKYFGGKPGWRLAIIPEGQKLATSVSQAQGAVSGR